MNSIMQLRVTFHWFMLFRDMHRITNKTLTRIRQENI